MVALWKDQIFNTHAFGGLVPYPKSSIYYNKIPEAGQFILAHGSEGEGSKGFIW
jgi:hypothetical protein